MSPDYDVIVVGGGPAGATAAMHCARAGLSTLILEKERLPRFKACGGGVTVKAEKALGFGIPDEIVERRAYGVRINYWGRVNECVKEKPITALVSRGIFDKFLADKAVSAGATLMDGAAVSSVTSEGPIRGVNSSVGRFDAKVVVGADGVNSVVADAVRRRLGKTELALGLEAEIPMSPGEIDARYGTFLDIYFRKSIWDGCGWVFPRKDSINVGLASMLRLFKNPRDKFIDFLKERGLPRDAEVHAHLIPLGSPNRKVVSDGIILVGDAAGYADPLTGEGIYAAVRSGQLAAQTIKGAAEKGRFDSDALSQYHGMCRHAFSDEFRRAWKAAAVVFGMPQISYPLILGNKSVLDRYTDVITGDLTYKAFKGWAQARLPALVSEGVRGR